MDSASTEHLLIDGFNFAHGKTRQKSGTPSTEIKRMVYELETHCVLKNLSMTVVFDGTRFEGEFSQSKGVRVICTRPKESADQVIEKLMKEVPPRERLQWVLVSDDAALRSMAAGSGLRLRRPEELAREIEASQKGGEAGPKPRKPFNNPFGKL